MTAVKFQISEPSYYKLEDCECIKKCDGSLQELTTDDLHEFYKDLKRYIRTYIPKSKRD